MKTGVESVRSVFLLYGSMLLFALSTRGVAAAQADQPARVCVSPSQSDELTRDARQAVRWSFTWGSLLGLSAATQLTLAAIVDDRGARIDRLVGGASSTLGVLALAVGHPRAARKRSSLGACASAADLALTLESVAAEERFTRAWYRHVLGAAFNLGVGLYLALVHDRTRSGVMQVLLGTAISSTMILTRPRRVAELVLLPTASSSSRMLGLTLSTRF